jgi:hypothetical protein
MTNQFLRRILPKIHKKITDELQGEPIKLFFEEESHVWEYETISGDLMESLALTTEQVDLIMGILYVNLRDTPEEYASVEKFKKPSKVSYLIDKDEIWTARQTYIPCNGWVPS